MEVFEEMNEDELKEVLDNHGNRITKLEIDTEVFKEKFNNITTQLTRIENNSLSNNNALLASNNSVLQTMNKIVEGNTTNNTNKKEIIIKVVTVISAIVVGWLSAKYGFNIKI